MRSLLSIVCLLFSTYAFSQQLTATLSLRIGPSIGFPYNIELPSGSDITIVQRRDDWLMVEDGRGETGWALLKNVDAAGGLAERQAWRLVELEAPPQSMLSAQWFSNKSGQGWGIGWAVPVDEYRLGTEYQQSKNYNAYWQSLSSWLTAMEPISTKTFFRYGLGIGYGRENEESHVLSDQGEAQNSGYLGGELSLGVAPNQEFETAVRLRYLFADLRGENSTYSLSWYWSLGI